MFWYFFQTHVVCRNLKRVFCAIVGVNAADLIDGLSHFLSNRMYILYIFFDMAERETDLLESMQEIESAQSLFIRNCKHTAAGG